MEESCELPVFEWPRSKMFLVRIYVAENACYTVKYHLKYLVLIYCTLYWCRLSVSVDLVVYREAYAFTFTVLELPLVLHGSIDWIH